MFQLAGFFCRSIERERYRYTYTVDVDTDRSIGVGFISPFPPHHQHHHHHHHSGGERLALQLLCNSCNPLNRHQGIHSRRSYRCIHKHVCICMCAYIYIFFLFAVYLFDSDKLPPISAALDLALSQRSV